MSLTIWPVGGVGEFGANCLVLELPGGERLVLDTGVALGTLEDYGVGFEVPDFAGLHKPEPLAVVLSHGHDDHLKGLPFFQEAFPRTQVVTTPGTWPWVRRLLGDEVSGFSLSHQELPLGSLRLEGLPVSHSIPGSALVRVTTEGGTVVLATDFRLAPSALGEETDQEKLARWGDEGVDVLLLDATNALVEQAPPSESTVAATLMDLVAEASGAVVAVSFASHAGRFKQLADAALAAGRVLVPLGRGIEEMLAVQGEQGFLRLPPGVLRSPRELPRLARDQVVLVVTGSQGEPFAVFPRLARDELANFHLAPGDVVIHAARVIPGNERRLDHLFDHCVRRGARVITAQEAPVHASGHAPVSEMARVLELVRPNWVVPIHGRLRHLAALADFAKGKGVKAVLTENGRPLVYQGGYLEASHEERGIGRILVGPDQETLDAAVVWERKAAALRGVVVAVLAVPARLDVPLPNPHIECFGLRLPGVNRAHLASELGGLLRRQGSPWGHDPEALRATMQQWLTTELRKRLAKSPRVVALVVEF